MVSSRSIAASKLGWRPPSRSAAGVAAVRFFSAGMSSSGPHRLDARVGLAARELERQPLAHREPGRAPHQSTVGPARQAIAALEHQARRERAQPVPVAHQLRALDAHTLDQDRAEPRARPGRLLAPPADLARPLAQAVALDQPEQAVARAREAPPEGHDEPRDEVVDALLLEPERVALAAEAVPV